MPHSVEERVAVLEVHVLGNEEDVKRILLEIKEHMEGEDERWEAIDDRLRKLENFASKFTGFIGGITIVFAGLWTVLTFVVPYVVDIFKNGSH